jgi:hypothetical protein
VVDAEFSIKLCAEDGIQGRRNIFTACTKKDISQIKSQSRAPKLAKFDAVLEAGERFIAERTSTRAYFR